MQFSGSIGLDTGLVPDGFDFPDPSKLKKRLHKRYSMLIHGSGVDVMGAEWDNLVLLDACRLDSFERECDLQGDLSRVLSTGGSSWEFMKDHFAGNQYHDTVYITGNAHSSKLANGVFFSIVPVDMESVSARTTPYPGPLPDGSKAILPEAVVEQTLFVHERFPNKRLIAHFMQPHLPFLGEYGRQLYSRILDSSVKDQFVMESRWGLSINIWQAARHPNVDVDDSDVEKAYRENLSIVLDSVEQLIEQLDGRTVITSDHAQLLGDRVFTKKRYGHPHDIHPVELIEVPWFEVQSKNRREITCDIPIDSKRLSAEEVNERLYELGYIDR